MTTTVTPWISPGASGDRAYFSDLGHFRTELGVAWTIATFVRLDTTSPGVDGRIFSLRRLSNDVHNHELFFDDNNNQLSYTYNFGVENDAGVMAPGTWYLAAMTYPGSGTTVTSRLISTAGAQIGSSNGTAQSLYGDGQTQQLSYGAGFGSGSTFGEHPCRLALPLILSEIALSQTELEAYAVDPLNYGDLLVALQGASVKAWIDDSRIDQSPNGATLTLEGDMEVDDIANVAHFLVVPDRAAVGTDVTLAVVGVKGLWQFYDLERAVPYSGAEFGADAPLIELTDDPLGVANLVVQTVRTWGDTAGTFDCVRGALTPGPRYLKITNQTIGDLSYGQSALQQVDFRADTGAGVVATRRTIPSQSSAAGVAIATFDGAGEFYLRNAQDTVGYDLMSGSFPDGVSVDPVTGEVSGTIDADAADDSPYTAAVRAADLNGDYAVQIVSWVVADSAVVVPTEKAPGSWGRRARQP